MSVLEYFEIEARPVIVDRLGGVAWEWSRGRWRDAPDLVEKSCADDSPMDQESLVQAYPHAALELLVSPRLHASQ